MEDWREIESFPGYSISDQGRVRNDETGRLMALLVNQDGIVNVGLTKDRIQHKRAVAPLVARAFLDTPMSEAFDTPVNLDGDRNNNTVDNLIWRPRWFAVKYFQQFLKPARSLMQPVEDLSTGEVFETSWKAAIRFGLLHRDLVLSILSYKEVWPTYQRFRVLYTDIE